MKLQLQRPIVFFDLETTGTDVNVDRIIEFAAIKVHPDGTQQPLRFLVHPGVAIPAEATAVHGYADADVATCPRWSEVGSQARAFFEDCDIGGYNVIGFDIPLLNAEFVRCNLPGLDLSVHIIDAFKIFCQRESRDLSAAVRRYCGHDHIGAHGALADTQATIAVVEGQLAMYADIGQTPEALFAEAQGPDAVDLAGKIRWVDGEMVLTFGKHKGRRLRDIDRSYFQWAIREGVFGSDVRTVIQEASNGRFQTLTI